jgi:hypothetical protein
MADLAAGEPKLKTKSTLALLLLGEACAQLDVLRQGVGANAGKWYLGDNNVDAATAKIQYMALIGGAANDYVPAITEGDVDWDTALVQGTSYVLSANAGKTCPFADLVSGNQISPVGFAVTTGLMRVKISASGQTKT